MKRAADSDAGKQGQHREQGDEVMLAEVKPEAHRSGGAEKQGGEEESWSVERGVWPSALGPLHFAVQTLLPPHEQGARPGQYPERHIRSHDRPNTAAQKFGSVDQ